MFVAIFLSLTEYGETKSNENIETEKNVSTVIHFHCQSSRWTMKNSGSFNYICLLNGAVYVISRQPSSIGHFDDLRIAWFGNNGGHSQTYVLLTVFVGVTWSKMTILSQHSASQTSPSLMVRCGRNLEKFLIDFVIMQCVQEKSCFILITHT